METIGIRVFVNKVLGNIYLMLVGIRGQCFKHGLTGMILLLGAKGDTTARAKPVGSSATGRLPLPAAEGGRAGRTRRQAQPFLSAISPNRHQPPVPW